MKFKNLFRGFKPKKSAMLMLALLALQGSAGISKVGADTVAEFVHVPGEYVQVRTSTGVHDTGEIIVKSNGKEEVAFCIEPNVLIPLGYNSGYSGKDRTDISARAEQIATLWSTVSTDKWYYFVAQAMIWEQMDGLQAYGIDGLSDTDFQNIKSQINQAVDNYNKKPSFDRQIITVKLGETAKVTDTKSVGISSFSSLTPASNANVDYKVSGNELSITPKKDSNLDGFLRFMKPLAVGTSVVYQKYGSQTLMVAKITDPNVYQLNIKVIKTGKSQVQKLDAETGKPMAGVKFKMTVDGKDYDVTTNEKGIGFIDKEFLHDTEVTYKEVKTLDGYVLNETPIKGKIKAGETITLSINNETQKGRVKGHKDKEVYNAEKSDEAGMSIYDKVPLANITFDQVAQNDITRPSGEVVLKKGEIADTFTTDENGDFLSTKDFYIGAQNQYKLIEREVPKNYRPLYDEQATFSIPYDSENKTKVFTLDMGTLDNDLKTGTFDLEKIDSDTGKIIPKTEFLLRGLSAYNRDVLYTITTGDKATIDKLIEGKYELVEVKYADGHTANAGETLTKIIGIKDGQTTKVEIKNDKITVKAPKVAITSKAHVKNGSQSFIEGDKLVMYDNISITHEHVEDGTVRSFDSILVARTPDGKENDIWKSGKINYTVKDSKHSQTVETKEIDTKDYSKGTVFYFRAVGYDENGNKDSEHNNDGQDKDQQLIGKPSLPMTGEAKATLVGLVGAVIIAVIAFLKHKEIAKAVLAIKSKTKKYKN